MNTALYKTETGQAAITSNLTSKLKAWVIRHTTVALLVASYALVGWALSL